MNEPCTYCMSRELLHYAGRTPQFAQKQMAPNPELEHDFHLQVERMLLADVRKETAESRVVNNTVVRAVGEDDHGMVGCPNVRHDIC